jgi:hypothetical protein
MLRPHAAALHTLPVQDVRALMQDQDSKTVALHIHKCMCIVDQAASSAVLVSADVQLANDVLPANNGQCLMKLAYIACLKEDATL